MVIGIFLIVFCTAAGSGSNTVSPLPAMQRVQDSAALLRISGQSRPQLTAHAKGAPRPDWLPAAFSASTAAEPQEVNKAQEADAETFSEMLNELYDPPYAYSEQEKAYIARVVYAEARGEKFEGKVAVAAVVLNRFESGLYGKSVKRVVFARNQFAVSKRYSAECLEAVEAAIDRDDTYPDDMYYFRVSKSKKWRNFDYHTRIGNHSFYCA